MSEPLRNPSFWILVLLLASVAAAAGTGGLYYRKRRNEKETVRRLLTLLRDHRALRSPLYLEQPLSASESVRGIRVRLRDALETLPESSKAYRPVREMHQACLSFLTQTGFSPMPEESDPLSKRWMAASGARRRALEDALIRLRRILNACMNQLYEAYGIEKPPLHEADEEGNEAPRSL